MTDMADTFDLRLARDKNQINDAVGQRLPKLGPVPNQQPMRIPGNPRITPQGLAVSGQQPMGPGMISGGAIVGPQGFGGGGVNYNMPAAGGNLNFSAGVDPRMQLSQLQGQYQRGPFSIGAEYQPGRGVSGGVSYRQPFQEGGLATSLRHDPSDYQHDEDFVETSNRHMQNMVGIPMSDGGGAWTRKEGQNPEGGLNAAGRASLKAQGHDIKPPVSAKQAKKSPKAAARRKSFCARSAGQAKMFPAAAKDPDSRLSKARRKWDC
jgi:hypothetical protein